ncbi:MAG: GAF domain-containing protein, partial [Pseudonocardiaceae bacterium]
MTPVAAQLESQQSGISRAVLGRYGAKMPAARPRHRLVEEMRAASGRSRDAIDLATTALTVIRRQMPVDAAFVSAVDPATMLFTQLLYQEVPVEVAPQFLRNEFTEPDVAKFRSIAAARDPVEWLDRATRGVWQDSPRYRTILRPLGLGDELRVALRTGTTCWGVMCMHRASASTGFTTEEAIALAAAAGHLGTALRRHVLTSAIEPPGDTAELPALLVLDARDTVVSHSAGADRWLAELAGSVAGHRLPVPVQAVLGQLRAGTGRPVVQLRTRAGWVCVRAAALQGTGDAQTAV